MINFKNVEDAEALALAIVNTIPEPLLVLDREFRVLAAGRSFYETFKVSPENTLGRLLYTLGDGQWDIPALRVLLETIIPERSAMDGFAVEHDFPSIGHRTMLLNARKVLYGDSLKTTILLAFSDITARVAVEKERAELLAETEELLRQKRMLLQEMRHRIANSLSIIASILMLKARAVSSGETRRHLEDAHQRVLSVAAVQRHLNVPDGLDKIEARTYLSDLCFSIGSSIVGEGQPIGIVVNADAGQIEPDKAVSLGLIVTELLINAIKYAFPTKTEGAEVVVTYQARGTDWTLIVADNGIGKSLDETAPSTGGLGTAIVKALVMQLDATMIVANNRPGVCVSIARETSVSDLPKAA